MAFYIGRADRKRKKYQIRGELWNGRLVKLPGDRDRAVAEHMRKNIELLDRAKRFGELPPASVIPWIEGLSEEELARYVSLGLLDRRFAERRRPIEELLKDFLAHTKLNCKGHSREAETKVVRIRRLFDAIGSTLPFKDLTPDLVLWSLKNFNALSGHRRGQSLSRKTTAEYVAAIKSFGDWMVRTGRAASNPLGGMQTLAARSAPVRNRRPLTVAEFSKLMSYLRSAADNYPHRLLKWTSLDRLLIYWTAVMTGFRMRELRSLTRADLNLDSTPARVTMEGWFSKNGRKTTIPIGDDLARALRSYCKDMPPTAPLLRMPHQTAVLKAFYRDLDAAGVRRVFDDGSSVDFHTLRSTAICWWITENKLHLLDVQYRARLKTLELVQAYVNGYTPNYERLVTDTPRVIDPDLPFGKAS
jgi:integrase